MITRFQYLNGEFDHDQYYNQFVNGPIIYLVGGRLGNQIAKSSDPYFNDISLRLWDLMAPNIKAMLDLSKLKQAGETWSLSTSICIAKQAAKLIKKGIDKNN